MAAKTEVSLASSDTRVTSEEIELLFGSIIQRLQDMQRIPSNNYTEGKYPPSEFVAAMHTCGRYMDNVEREYFSIVESLDKSIMLAKQRPETFPLDQEYFEAAQQLRAVQKISRAFSLVSKGSTGILVLAGIVGALTIAYWLAGLFESDLKYIVFTVATLPFWGAATYVAKK